MTPCRLTHTVVQRTRVWGSAVSALLTLGFLLALAAGPSQAQAPASVESLTQALLALEMRYQVASGARPGPAP